MKKKIRIKNQKIVRRKPSNKRRHVDGVSLAHFTTEEKQIIQAAESASIKAQQKMLSLGYPVIKLINGEHYRVFPDGKKKLIRRRANPMLFTF